MQKIRKLASFVLPAIMILHMIFLEIRYLNGQPFNLSPGSYGCFILILYLLLITGVTAITVAGIRAKNAFTAQILSVLKLSVSLFANFMIFIIMLIAYNNPSMKQIAETFFSCLLIAIVALVLFLPEFFYLQKKPL